ncbi:Uncharacterised protein [Vibrio cholerae]|nr:Uncharacterised protein [Vibrio cholerae]
MPNGYAQSKPALLVLHSEEPDACRSWWMG